MPPDGYHFIKLRTASALTGITARNMVRRVFQVLHSVSVRSRSPLRLGEFEVIFDFI